MNCPECGKEMQEGMVMAETAGNPFASTMVHWFSKEEAKKKFFKRGINLRLKGEGYYCDECMKAVAVFDEKQEW